MIFTCYQEILKKPANFHHFREIASVIVVSKRIFEEELAKLAQAKLKSIETNTEMSQMVFSYRLKLMHSKNARLYDDNIRVN